MKASPRMGAELTLGAILSALMIGSLPVAAQQNNGQGGGDCVCVTPATLNQIYAGELQMSPRQVASKHCAIAPTFLDMEQSVVRVSNRKIATDQALAPGVVSTEPEVKINAQFLIYIDSNPNKPMASCEVKTVRNARTTRDVKVDITHQQAFACMEEIQTSRTWDALCTADVLKRQ